MRTAIVFGSTGLVGSHLLTYLLKSKDYGKIINFVRRPSGLRDEKMIELVVDFEKPAEFSHRIVGDDIFLCIGTTMAKAGSKEAFLKVDYTYNLNAAQSAFQNGIKKCLLVSAIGADEKSSVFYSKVKGKLEKDISSLGFESLDIFRPSLLLGNRSEFRPGEKIAVLASIFFRPLFHIFKSVYTPIHADIVANAMLMAALSKTNGVKIHTYQDMIN